MNRICYGLMILTLLSCVEAAKNSRNTDDGKGPRTEDRPNAGTNDTTKVYRSQTFRNKDKKQLSYNELTTQVATSTDDSGYRTIPDFQNDNDSTVIMNDYKQNNCGIVVEIKNIKSRKNNCVQQNPTGYRWSGQANGISGEGDWDLVYKNKDDNEDVTVWQDLTTGMLWSTPIKNATWKEASGSDNSPDYVCGDLKLLDGEVKWMLPTRSEFFQADVNGARYVLPEVNTIYWTATQQGRTGKAWAILQSTGEITLLDIATTLTREVRCVGIPLK